jgi:hypothetical protein
MLSILLSISITTLIKQRYYYAKPTFTTHTQMTQNHTHPQMACSECFHSFSVAESNHKENKHAGKKLAVKRQAKNVSNIDFARLSACVAGSRQVTCLAWGRKVMYRTDCGTLGQ